jgi:predicted HTH domain antitoxin
MMIDLPALSAGGRFTAEELRLELAGVDFFTFQQALSERQIPAYADERPASDIETLGKLFPA